jgi:hypothetical protein
LSYAYFSAETKWTEKRAKTDIKRSVLHSNLPEIDLDNPSPYA